MFKNKKWFKKPLMVVVGPQAGAVALTLATFFSCRWLGMNNLLICGIFTGVVSLITFVSLCILNSPFSPPTLEGVLSFTMPAFNLANLILYTITIPPLGAYVAAMCIIGILSAGLVIAVTLEAKTFDLSWFGVLATFVAEGVTIFAPIYLTLS
jgi:hypothetical protein